MRLYHGINVLGLNVLEPRLADHDRPYVYMTTIDAVAALYLCICKICQRQDSGCVGDVCGGHTRFDPPIILSEPTAFWSCGFHLYKINLDEIDKEEEAIGGRFHG